MPTPLVVDGLLLGLSVCTCSVLFASAAWRRLIMLVGLLCAVGILVCLMFGSLVSVALAVAAYLLLAGSRQPQPGGQE